VPGAPKQSSGFSLVELLIAVLLGLVVIAGIIQLFVGNSQASAVLSGQARLQENARYALEYISRGARQAGNFGCAPRPQNVVKGLVGEWAQMPEYDITRAVDGHEGRVGGTWSPPLARLPGGSAGNVNHDPRGAIDTSLVVDETDVLVFRNIQQPGTRLTQSLSPDGDPVVRAPGGDPGFSVGDIVMVADCEQSAVFRVTSMTVGTSDATLFRAGGTGLFDNASHVNSPAGLVPLTLSRLGRPYGPEAVIGAVQATYFFVAPSLHEGNDGANPLALWQKVGGAAPVELIQGVEDLQVLYGVDTTLADGLSNPNQYVAFDRVPANVQQIVSVRTTVRVNSVDAVTRDGRRLTRTFSKTVFLRNARAGA
jgi:type IV pilus assembly protein PilW